MIPDKLKWHSLDPAIFPANVQKAITHARDARAVAAKATDEASKMIQTFAPRIAVEGVKVLQEGEVLVVSFRFGKLTVASAPAIAKSKSSGKAAALLA